MNVIEATERAADALDRLAASLRQMNAQNVTAPTMPTNLPMMGGGSDMDRERADWRRRLQDPQEIEALKRRLGLR